MQLDVRSSAAPWGVEGSLKEVRSSGGLVEHFNTQTLYLLQSPVFIFFLLNICVFNFIRALLATVLFLFYIGFN